MMVRALLSDKQETGDSGHFYLAEKRTFLFSVDMDNFKYLISIILIILFTGHLL